MDKWSKFLSISQWAKRVSLYGLDGSTDRPVKVNASGEVVIDGSISASGVTKTAVTLHNNVTVSAGSNVRSDNVDLSDCLYWAVRCKMTYNASAAAGMRVGVWGDGNSGDLITSVDDGRIVDWVNLVFNAGSTYTDTYVPFIEKVGFFPMPFKEVSIQFDNIDGSYDVTAFYAEIIKVT